jgi:chemotaxis protein CheX
MNLEIVNPFVNAAFTVLENVLEDTPSKGPLQMLERGATSQQVNITVGLTGDIVGHIIYGLSLDTAARIASAMLEQPVDSFDQLAASAIGELANMISGNGLLHLFDAGFVCDVTPPSVISGLDVEFNTLAIPALVVPLLTEQGELYLTIGLRKVK